VTDGSIDWTIITTSSAASGNVAMIMSIPMTARGITGYGSGRDVLKRLRQM
jgi:hypothetical protein